MTYIPMLAKVYVPEDTILRFPCTVQPKYDGVRLLWDGRDATSRTGKPLSVPSVVLEELRERFSGIALDGELYGHGLGFQKIVSLARGRSHAGTTALDYVVFDLPKAGVPWADRLQQLEALVDEHPDGHVRRAPTIPVSSYAQIEDLLKHWVSLGYEGLMIRSYGPGYQHCRTDALLKYKRWRECRAECIDVAAGEGKHAGRLGALCCQTRAGKRFSVGTGFSDQQREEFWDSPPVRRDILVKYQEESSGGVPRFPVFVEVCA